MNHFLLIRDLKFVTPSILSVYVEFSWVIEGGELNDTCGEIYSNTSVVMSGRTKARRLCTPYLDLTHAQALHFYYSQGIHLII